MATAAEEIRPAGAFVPSPFRVAERRQDTADTWTLAFEPLGDGFAVVPGQFVMVYAFGIGEVPISVSGPPERPGEPVVLTIRAVGAVTRAICASEPGAVLGLRGPLGNSWPVEQAAGGDLVVEVTVDAADTGWTGRVGVVPQLVAQTNFRPEAVTAFVCGPEVMIHF